MRRLLALPLGLILAVPLVVVAGPASATAMRVSLVSDSSYLDSAGYLHVVGEVANTSGLTLQFVEIDADYYDASNRLLDTGTTFADLSTLAAGEKSPFELLSQPPQGYDHYVLTLAEGTTTDERPNHDFTVDVTNDTTDGTGFEHLVGTVTNNNSTTAQDVDLVFTFYDAAGDVVDTGLTFAKGSGDSHADIAAGQTASFELIRDASRAYTGRAAVAESDTPPSSGATAGPAPRTTDNACPPDRVPSAGFTDVPASNVHRHNIDCVVWWQVANGTSPSTYAPSRVVPRDQMAAFIARLITHSGGTLPANPPDAFPDDNGNQFEPDINALAAAGIVQGSKGGYHPADSVSRGSMAAFLSRAYAYRSGASLLSSADYFTDDRGSVFEQDINDIAEVGISGGYADGTYRPGVAVTRDQMASFLARELDLFVVNGVAAPPGTR